MSVVLAMLLDWATKEGRDLRVFTFDFNKFFDRYILGKRCDLYCARCSQTFVQDSMC